ncbi:MAG: outer membrane lipoprotein chaperone LolA [Gammaproteobacteria bacterium]|nr:outer membrane lipoprotein chaperone LolA [Gammaproteobacteria bacterium]NIR82361.1 outer membrane lipoprotein chaperone LolA [Gammaproteobacteria bacterium]NIR91956.1 outer membrane lipoprotein chaperone LolA [Gammaproteobacteria bacterium]NIV76984.1 outer membrane lipoprotein chaperone LolA [Gammaproteobacteria bacterium]
MLGMSPPAGAQGESARERLAQFFEQVRSLRASFEQTLLDETGEPVQDAAGTVWLQRPGKFRWDYATPYEQVIVSDGARVWVYDADLAQVTVRPQAQGLDNGAMMLLSGEGSLEAQYEIRELESRDARQWIELVPRAERSEFRRVRLGFGSHGLEVMELVDTFGQTTRLRFNDVALNPKIAPSRFEFTPPEGVDVIRSSS